jgi:hypothetical protein
MVCYVERICVSEIYKCRIKVLRRIDVTYFKNSYAFALKTMFCISRGRKKCKIPEEDE